MARKFDRHVQIYFAVATAVVIGAAGTILALATDRAERRGVETSIQIERGANHPVHIRKPAGAPRVHTGQTDFHGQPVTVSCSTCHATTTPNPQTRSSQELDEFHQGLTFDHGQLSCLSCHNAGNYDSLRLADGAPVAFEDVQELCAQCHGPQTRDYRNGSHGGMNGFWDLTRGPRTRNNCTDCHDPHAPQFQPVMPVFAPAPAGKTRNSH